jgi:hypothetical protein
VERHHRCNHRNREGIMEYSKGEVRRWRADDVTLDLFNRIKNEIVSMDATVHSLLLNGQPEEAGRLNARLQQLKEVEMLPTQMIEEAKGE